MEIFTLAELQRMSAVDNWVFQACTSWDCPILPTLAFKPDCLWAFDEHGALLQELGHEKKIDMTKLSYVLQLEVIEESRKRHSKQRTPDDPTREKQIRHLFAFHAVPLGIIYCTVAHTKHMKAHSDDVFFEKNATTQEYFVPDSRLPYWQERLEHVFDQMISFVEHRTNETVFIGH